MLEEMNDFLLKIQDQQAVNSCHLLTLAPVKNCGDNSMREFIISMEP